MTDRDETLRNELGWTGPGDPDAEPASHQEPAPSPRPPVPPRPPADAHPQPFEAERAGNSFRQPVHGAPPGHPGGWGAAPGPQTWSPPTRPIQP
ncbi:MAG: MinD/ParA family protein, partial [Actinomycetota bacterium]|nr:MinD/ParA family protein [Actinomycetota bacterium]